MELIAEYRFEKIMTARQEAVEAVQEYLQKQVCFIDPGSFFEWEGDLYQCIKQSSNSFTDKKHGKRRKTRSQSIDQTSCGVGQKDLIDIKSEGNI